MTLQHARNVQRPIIAELTCDACDTFIWLRRIEDSPTNWASDGKRDMCASCLAHAFRASDIPEAWMDELLKRGQFDGPH